VNAEFLGSVVSSLHQGLGGSTGAGGQGAISPGYPVNATQNEIKIWDNTQKAFLNEEVRTHSFCVCLRASPACCLQRRAYWFPSFHNFDLTRTRR
jgi:hypothetical protein